MISQKESSTEYNPFYVSKAELEALDYIQHNLNFAEDSQNIALHEDILYLKNEVREVAYQLRDLVKYVEQKSIVFDESCDERYAEDWREI